jgi:colanic acid biosynthesis glycosyl transferase WcaI
VKIVLLNQFFPPARAPTGWVLADLAEELVRRGHAVTVLTSAAGYGAATGARRATPAGVRLVRVGQDGVHRTGVAAKLRDYLSFYRCAWRELESMPRPDALVCMTTPPFSGLLGARLRQRQGVPYVLWCMDLYPEALAAHGFLRPWNPLTPLLRQLARRERRRAAAVVVLGSDMAELVAASGARRIEEIPFWTAFAPTPALEAEARALRRARGWADDDIVLLYSGNMGRAHRAEEFAALAERLQGRTPRCRFVFSGGGPQQAAWQRRWGGTLDFLPDVPDGSYLAHLLAADVHLVSQQPAWRGVVVPSKFPIACALGRPVVYAGPPQSAVGAWIAQAAAGWILPPGAAAALETAAREIGAAALRAAKGANAARLHAAHFTQAANGAMLAELVESIADARP